MRRPAGSSPRTRGTAPIKCALPGLSRFIPAHAGNSWVTRVLMACPPVHPRARGEQVSLHATLHPVAGSSPRTRGTVHVHAAQHLELRFIPAHAGNRRCRSACRRRSPVHPRARGEQSWGRLLVGDGGGSSPRTRGTDRPSGWRRPASRFIPGHAGNRVTLPLFRVALNPRFTRPFYAVPRTSAARTASG